MDSFDELSLSAELVEALAAEGLERPTDLQEHAIPVLRRGHNLVAVAGPGAGLLVAVTAPLLDRIEPADAPAILVLTPTRERATALAESTGRLAQALGHRAAAATGPWVLPERASLLFSTPTETRVWLRESRLSLEAVKALVVDGAATMEATGALEDVEVVLESLAPDVQRVLVALPITAALESLAERHLKKAVHVPPRAAQHAAASVPDRGRIRVREVQGARETVVAELCADLLDDDARHVTLFVRSEDSAADLGDGLALRGFLSGPVGQGDVPVWLAVDDMEARRAMDAAGAEVAVVSVDVPTGPDALDRRHGGGRGGVVLAEPREMPHLRDVARRTGYRLEMAPAVAATGSEGGLAGVLRALTATLDDDGLDVDAYQIVLEPLLERHGAGRVAAAALGLLRARGLPAGSAATPGTATAAGEAGAAGGALPATVKLFVSLGTRDAIGPGDLVGAITGEAGIQGSQIGRIDLRDTFSIVEVDAAVAMRVIEALNGTTVKGRSVRVDLDRAERERGASRGRPSGPPGRRPGGGPGGRRPPGGGGRGPTRDRPPRG